MLIDKDYTEGSENIWQIYRAFLVEGLYSLL